MRIVRQTDGHARIDPTGKAPGRGAYLHTNLACWNQALNGGRLAHALKLDRLEESDRAELQAYAAAFPKEDEHAQ